MTWLDGIDAAVWNNLFSGIGGAAIGAWLGTREARRLARRAERLLIAERLHDQLSLERDRLPAYRAAVSERDLQALVNVQPLLRRRRVRAAAEGYRRERESQTKIDDHGQSLWFQPSKLRAAIEQLLQYAQHE